MQREPNQDHVFYRNLRKFYPTVSHGEGIYLYDTDGKRYIDGSGGAAVVSIGHGVREITEATPFPTDPNSPARPLLPLRNGSCRWPLRG